MSAGEVSRSEYHVSSPSSGLAVGVCVCVRRDKPSGSCVCVCVCAVSQRGNQSGRLEGVEGVEMQLVTASEPTSQTHTHTHANYDKTRRTSPKGEKKHNEISLASQFILQDRAN